MRITKFHILILLIIGGLCFLGYYYVDQDKKSKEMERVRIETEMARQKQQEIEAKKKMEEIALSSATAAVTPETTPPKTPGNGEPAPTTYAIQKGDTLWKIAKMKSHFGQGHRWYDIWKANEESIDDFDHVKEGDVLTIPLDKPDGYPWNKTSADKKQRILGQSVKTKNPKVEPQDPAPPSSGNLPTN